MSGGMDRDPMDRPSPTPPERLRLWVSGVFPGMNEITKAAKSGRGKSNGYSRMKASNDARVVFAVKVGGGRVFPVPARVSFVWHVANRRHDPDNVSAAQKFILDGLVKAGVLKNDSMNEIASLSHEFRVTPDRPGVEVTLTEVV